MNKNLFIIIALFLTVPISGVAAWGTNHGDNHPTEKGCNKAKSLKDYARLVDDMLCKGDDIDKDKILAFPDVNQKEEKCIDHRADLGNELYEDEIMHCYKNNN
jgi:hypothetical protein